MAREVVGVVQDILDKATEKGQEYLVLRIEDEGYFDWKGLVAQKQVKVGDKVRLRVSDGQFPRIYDLEKVGDAEFKKAQAHGGTVPSARTGSRELITRLSCIRSAALGIGPTTYGLRDLRASSPQCRPVWASSQVRKKRASRSASSSVPYGSVARS